MTGNEYVNKLETDLSIDFKQASNDRKKTFVSLTNSAKDELSDIIKESVDEKYFYSTDVSTLEDSTNDSSKRIKKLPSDIIGSIYSLDLYRGIGDNRQHYVLQEIDNTGSFATMTEEEIKEFFAGQVSSYIFNGDSVMILTGYSIGVPNNDDTLVITYEKYPDSYESKNIFGSDIDMSINIQGENKNLLVRVAHNALQKTVAYEWINRNSASYTVGKLELALNQKDRTVNTMIRSLKNRNKNRIIKQLPVSYESIERFL